MSIANNIGSGTQLPQPSDYASSSDFVNACCDSHDQHKSVQNILSKPPSSFNFRPVTTSEVAEMIKSLNKKKATGLDEIPSKAMVPVCDLLAPPLTFLFNQCVSTKHFPRRCKLAMVSPIYKKDDPLDGKNYRPVSILTASSKILERCMETQLQDFLARIYNPATAAFRRGYSCQQVLLRFCDTWRRAVEERDVVGAVLLDLSKAFDCLPFSLIIAKLKAYGMDANAVELIANYLTNRAQCVKVGSTLSSFKELSKGVPQGSILGPLIFNVFINDIYDAVKHGSLINYADDNTLIASAPNLDLTKNILNVDTANLMEWIKTNEMQANPSKFQIMFSDRTLTSLRIENVSVQSENCVKLLGVHIDNRLTFDHHVSEICRKAANQINMLVRICRHLNTNVKLLLYKSFVMCNFNYCPVVWHSCGKVNTQKLEKLQFRALKFVFNDHTSSYETLLSRANLPSLEIGRLRSIALEVFKCQNQQNPVFLNALFTTSTPSHSYNLRHNHLLPSHSRTTRHGLNSFTNYGIHIWNSLPAHFRSTNDFNVFKTMLKTWNGPSCRCSMCNELN